jgi:adenine-specific DNA-methyltransferase
MATGIPRANGKKIIETVRLEYAGKKPVEKILQSQHAELIEVGKRLPSDNMLIFADNLSALAALAQDERIVGKIRMVYIDPPFATQSAFQSRKLSHAYEDLLSGAEFIEFLRERLVWLHHLLSDDGSLYLHLDERMVFHFRIILDEIFGASKYRNCITRKKCNPKNYTRKTYGNVADYILFYTKSDNYVWNRPHKPWSEERIIEEYQYVEPETGRRYKKVPIHAPGVRNGDTGKPWRGMLPPMGKHWQYLPTKLDELDAKGNIYWSPTGNPRRKVYMDESRGIPLQDIWMDLRDAHNQNIHITGYPTEKNPDLLRRIILASSNPGDMVLDCFSGSGTTLAVSSELERRWIGIDNSPEAIRITLKRFAMGLEPMGDYVSKKTNNIKTSLLPIFSEEIELLGKHKPIEDFTLYAESNLIEELRSLIAEHEHTIELSRGTCKSSR